MRNDVYHYIQDGIKLQRRGFLLSDPEDDSTYHWVVYKSGDGKISIKKDDYDRPCRISFNVAQSKELLAVLQEFINNLDEK